jgi:guanylate kinase
MKAENAFLENAEVFGNFYGTSRAWVEDRLGQGWDVILEIDWQGAAQVQALMPGAVSIFILPPSLDALRDRLTTRGQDDASVIEKRMAAAVDEISHYGQADYIIFNETFETALDDLKAVTRSARLGKNHQLLCNQALLDRLVQGYRDTGIQGYRDTGIQGYRVGFFCFPGTPSNPVYLVGRHSPQGVCRQFP